MFAAAGKKTPTGTPKIIVNACGAAVVAKNALLTAGHCVDFDSISKGSSPSFQFIDKDKFTKETWEPKSLFYVYDEPYSNFRQNEIDEEKEIVPEKETKVNYRTAVESITFIDSSELPGRGGTTEKLALIVLKTGAQPNDTYGAYNNFSGFKTVFEMGTLQDVPEISKVTNRKEDAKLFQSISIFGFAQHFFPKGSATKIHTKYYGVEGTEGEEDYYLYEPFKNASLFNIQWELRSGKNLLYKITQEGKQINTYSELVFGCKVNDGRIEPDELILAEGAGAFVGDSGGAVLDSDGKLIGIIGLRKNYFHLTTGKMLRSWERFKATEFSKPIDENATYAYLEVATDIFNLRKKEVADALENQLKSLQQEEQSRASGDELFFGYAYDDQLPHWTDSAGWISDLTTGELGTGADPSATQVISDASLADPFVVSNNDVEIVVAHEPDDCPRDPEKLVSGACGCNFPDTDSDGDGTPDCIDECSADPAKLSSGLCGCGIQDTDSDGDAVPDCADACISDPLKIDSGICGCGISDTDSDGDQMADCNDDCPLDPSKLSAEACGCGVPEVDSDGDGFLDCHDGCPNDTNKIEAGVFGCGQSEDPWPLHRAVLENDISEVAELLIAAADINQLDGNGRTPIEYALEQNFRDIVLLLLREPLLDVSMPYATNPFLLNIALENGDLEVAETLLKFQDEINPNSVGIDGVSALEQAFANNYWDIYLLISQKLNADLSQYDMTVDAILEEYVSSFSEIPDSRTLETTEGTITVTDEAIRFSSFVVESVSLDDIGESLHSLVPDLSALELVAAPEKQPVPESTPEDPTAEYFVSAAEGLELDAPPAAQITAYDVDRVGYEFINTGSELTEFLARQHLLLSEKRIRPEDALDEKALKSLLELEVTLNPTLMAALKEARDISIDEKDGKVTARSSNTSLFETLWPVTRSRTPAFTRYSLLAFYRITQELNKAVPEYSRRVRPFLQQLTPQQLKVVRELHLAVHKLYNETNRKMMEVYEESDIVSRHFTKKPSNTEEEIDTFLKGRLGNAESLRSYFATREAYLESLKKLADLEKTLLDSKRADGTTLRQNTSATFSDLAVYHQLKETQKVVDELKRAALGDKEIFLKSYLTNVYDIAFPRAFKPESPLVSLDDYKTQFEKHWGTGGSDFRMQRRLDEVFKKLEMPENANKQLVLIWHALPEVHLVEIAEGSRSGLLSFITPKPADKNLTARELIAQYEKFAEFRMLLRGPKYHLAPAQ